MSRPIVGVIGNAHLVENRFRVHAVGERNLRAIWEVAGAQPVMFAGSPELNDFDALLGLVDGILLTGARANVHPTHFGAEPHPRTGVPSPDRDAWELALIEAALDAGLPLLGICRGMQLLNVALGGTLVQHLPDVVGHHGHAESEGVFGRHKVRPVPGTRLADALPEPAEVPTYHHQAVDRLGGGLVAVAHTDDGTVEAVELPGEAFVLAVQWHPEMGDDPRLLEALVAAAR